MHPIPLAIAVWFVIAVITAVAMVLFVAFV
jgi:hypothetical protein